MSGGQRTQHLIGLMSGTSLDGCDAALAAFTEDAVRLLHFASLPMPRGLKQRVQQACSLTQSRVDLICSLNVELAQFFAQAALLVCEQAGFPISQVAAIACHGQTVWHQPEAQGQLLPSTLQLGEPAVLAYLTRRPVVAGMRAMDMAAGGQGAPLVPLSEYLLYRGTEAVALQNLGGIGNVTVLPADCSPDQVFAFDTGPGNMIMDGFAQALFGQDYDRDGLLAAQGQVNPALLAQWMALPFIDAPPPKSTGRELFGQAFLQAALQHHASMLPHDLLATATAFTAHTMHRNYLLHVLPRCPDLKKIILGGGGAYNPTLRQMITGLFDGIQVCTQEELGHSSQAKEALAFAIIGHRTLRHLPGNLPAATGAREEVPLGSITYPPGYQPDTEPFRAQTP